MELAGLRFLDSPRSGSLRFLELQEGTVAPRQGTTQQNHDRTLRNHDKKAGKA